VPLARPKLSESCWKVLAMVLPSAVSRSPRSAKAMVFRLVNCSELARPITRPRPTMTGMGVLSPTCEKAAMQAATIQVLTISTRR
jgi:hypothetical protein